MFVQKCLICQVTARIALKTLMHCVGTAILPIMAKLTRHETEFEFSPWGIQRLFYDLPLSQGIAIYTELKKVWDETKPFEVEIEIPLKEHPHIHIHILNIEVDPVTQQVTTERRVGNDRFSSCPSCRLGRC